MTPKSLLRLPEARSSFDEMLPNSEFQRIYPDHGKAESNAQNVKRLVFCSGKVYYDLNKERLAKELDAEVALVRIEQVSIGGNCLSRMISAEFNDGYASVSVCFSVVCRSTV